MRSLKLVQAVKSAACHVLTAMVVLGVLALTARLTAQQPEVKPGPGPEHEKLKEAEGTWDAAIKAGEAESKGTLMCKVDLGGLWLLEHFKGDVAGMPFEGRGATSYDPAKKKYVNVWIDSMSTSPMVNEGAYNATTKTLTMSGDMPMPGGKSMKVTMTTVMTDTDNKTFTMKGAGPDGKEFEMMQITYKRRAK